MRDTRTREYSNDINVDAHEFYLLFGVKLAKYELYAYILPRFAWKQTYHYDRVCVVRV